MKDYPNKSFENVIPNAKALKNWLIFEKFQFFSLKLRLFRDIDYMETQNNAENLAAVCKSCGQRIQTREKSVNSVVSTIQSIPLNSYYALD